MFLEKPMDDEVMEVVEDMTLIFDKINYKTNGLFYECYD